MVTNGLGQGRLRSAVRNNNASLIIVSMASF